MIDLIFVQIQMSYAPVSLEQQQPHHKQQLKHRNPIYPSLHYPKPRPIHSLQSQIKSSLIFQQLIYYNWFYSLLFFYLYSISQIQRLIYFEIEYGIPVRVIIEIIFFVLQFFRLRNGYYGNLKQSFPQICAFLLLTSVTIALQFILIVGTILPTSPMEWTILFYGLIFHILQIIVCIFTMTQLTQAQKALFLWKNPISKR